MTGETLRLILLTVLIGVCTTDDDAEYVFKLQISDLKSSDLDMVFLIDGSSSVGEENFGLEIGFVRKLLSDFAVAENGTGVSVVVFGNHAVVYEHGEKCELLNSVLGGVRYPGGGTNTLGAFLAARELIMSKTRRGGHRKVAVFLITDGFSNGGDPLPVAQEIKTNYDAMIFTVGIRTGNARELQKIASSTSTSYLMESFQEFDLLARKALHVDLKDGDYIPVDPSKCDRCDPSAACTCGTTSGQYVCRCRPGHYGTGKPSECHPCPKSTYWNTKSGVCNPCPDPNHITDPSKPATNPNDCFCKPGYRKTRRDLRCEVITCPKLTPPENGYFVGVDACPKVMNAACGVRCNVGYSLKGNSIRVCRANGQWDGIPPNCHLKTCPKPPIPLDGSLECLNPDLDIKYTTLPDEMPVDTECTFNCSRGHSLVGSQKRTCLPVAQWDGLTTKCKPLRCARLSDIPHGRAKPDTCSKTKQSHGSKCRIDCNSGFVGPKEIECVTKGRHGTWSSKPKCIDIEPPHIKCPGNLKTTTTKGSPYGIITWDDPFEYDNSRINSTVWWEPSMTNENHNPHRFEIGTTTITYHAVDPSGNRASCNFTITVTDREPPVFDNCEETPPYLVGNPGVEIKWDKPVAFDNSGDEVTVIESHGYGVFPEGLTTVTYTAFDRYNNSAVCVMNITVQVSTCEAEMPTGNCSETPGGMQCVMTCEEGYAFPLTDEAVCDNQRPRWQIPDCTPTEIPQEITGTLPHPDLCRSLIEKCSGTDCEVVECNVIDRTKRAIGHENRTTRFRLRPTSHNLPKDVIRITGEHNLKPVCREGTVPLKYRCAKCPKGTYHNVSTGKCEACGIDSYNDVIGSTRCFSCPRGKATRGRRGSKSISACKRKISTVRHEPCRNDSCFYGKCVPIGRLRHRCVCSKGWIGARCRIPEVKHCLTKPCLNGGTCLSRRSGYTCRCPLGFGGDDCDAEIQEPQEEKLPPENVCRKFEGLCENNGSCYSLGSGYRCVCRVGYLGRRCQFVPCDYRPCPETTVCKDTPSTGLKTTRKDHKCECPEGRTGYPKCLQVTDKCGGCKNNATCSIDGVCQCLKSWNGPKCDQKFSSDYTAGFSKPSISDYITLEAPGVDLTSLTLCSWVKTNNTSNYGTIFSYTTEESDNTLTILDYSGLVIWINGQYEVTRIRISDGTWHHICLHWTSSDGSYKVYSDSRLKASGRGLSTGNVIKGGGTIVIGQEQDSPGGGFSRIESFVGEICYVDVWSKILLTEQNCRGYKGGDWASWAEFRGGLRGDVDVLPNHFCQGCTEPDEKITGGTIQVSKTHLTLNCQRGYRVVIEGRPTNNPMVTRECQASGRWEDEDLPWRCTRVQCNQPPRIPHGRLTNKRKRIYKYGDQVTYHCLEGYETQGNSTKTCLETGEWQDDLLECIGSHCLPFPVPDDLNLTIISEHVYDEDFRDIKRFEAGTVIEVACGEKQTLMVCLENQTWHGELTDCDQLPLDKLLGNQTVSGVNETASNESKRSEFVEVAVTTEGKPGGFEKVDDIPGGVEGVATTFEGVTLPTLGVITSVNEEISKGTPENGGVGVPKMMEAEDHDRGSVGEGSSPDESTTISGDVGSGSNGSEVATKTVEGESKTDEGDKVDEAASKVVGGEAKVDGEESKVVEGESKTNDGELKIDEEESKTDGGESKTGEEEPKAGEEEPKMTEEEIKTVEGESKPVEEVSKTGEGESKTSREESKTGEEDSKTGQEDSKTGQEDSKIGQEDSKIGQEDSKTDQDTSETGQDASKIAEGVTKTGEEVKGMTETVQGVQNISRDEFPPNGTSEESSKSPRTDDVLQKPEVAAKNEEVLHNAEVVAKNDEGGVLNGGISEQDEVKNETSEVLEETIGPPRTCRGGDVPPSPDNGYFIDIDFDDNTGYEVGTEVGYKCRTGYTLQGEQFSRCSQNGTWTPPKLSCEPVRCPIPPVHQNMLVKNGIGTGPYVFGNMVYYECEPGFSFYGNNVARCLANGRWSRLRGKCARISCGKPTVPADDEVVIGSSYLYKDSLRVMCPRSSPRESYEARCTHTGQWLYLGNCHQEPGRRR